MELPIADSSFSNASAERRLRAMLSGAQECDYGCAKHEHNAPYSEGVTIGYVTKYKHQHCACHY